MAYGVKWVQGGFVVTWHGATTSKELIQFINEAHADMRWDSVRFAVHDYSLCTKIISNPDDMEMVAALDKAGALTNPNIGVGIIAMQPVLVEMIQGYKESGLAPYPIELFSKWEDCIQWLEKLGKVPHSLREFI